MHRSNQLNETLTSATMTAIERETGEEESDEEESGDDYLTIIPILPPEQNLK